MSYVVKDKRITTFVRRVLIGYLVIFSCYFIVTAFAHTMVIKTRGVVVDYRHTRGAGYRSMRGTPITSPVIKFTGPQKTIQENTAPADQREASGFSSVNYNLDNGPDHFSFHVFGHSLVLDLNGKDLTISIHDLETSYNNRSYGDFDIYDSSSGMYMHVVHDSLLVTISGKSSTFPIWKDDAAWAALYNLASVLGPQQHFSVYDTGNVYITQGFEGSEDYRLGDSVTVFYYRGAPEDASILLFSTYWMSVPAFIVLFFVCVFWTAIYNIVYMKKYKDY